MKPQEKVPSLCQSCTHVRGLGWFCDAFPDGDGIPVDIQVGGDHRTSRPGDSGIVFELAEGVQAAEQLARWENRDLELKRP